MAWIRCSDCGRWVRTWSTTTTHQDGTVVSEAFWVCPCGGYGSRPIVTIDVHGTVLDEAG
jgi:hypothetical protein